MTLEVLQTAMSESSEENESRESKKNYWLDAADDAADAVGHEINVSSARNYYHRFSFSRLKIEKVMYLNKLKSKRKKNIYLKIFNERHLILFLTYFGRCTLRLYICEGESNGRHAGSFEARMNNGRESHWEIGRDMWATVATNTIMLPTQWRTSAPWKGRTLYAFRERLVGYETVQHIRLKRLSVSSPLRSPPTIEAFEGLLMMMTTFGPLTTLWILHIFWSFLSFIMTFQ